MNKNNNFEPKESKFVPLKPLWSDGRVPVNRVIETNSDKNHNYYGRFETYKDGGHRSFQSWIGKPNEKLDTEKVFKDIDPWFHGWLRNQSGDLKGVECVSGNINDLEWLSQVGERCWRSSLPENKSLKNEFTNTLEVDYSPEKNKITGSAVKNIPQSNTSLVESETELPVIVKENEELKQQLAEVQKKLTKALAELKTLKGKDNDQLVNELTQNQEKNQQLISMDNISVSKVREQVQKSEALLNKSNNISFIPNSNEKGNSIMPYLIGGGIVVLVLGVIIGIVGKKRIKKSK